jgi:hypothetical protein
MCYWKQTNIFNPVGTRTRSIWLVSWNHLTQQKQEHITISLWSRWSCISVTQSYVSRADPHEIKTTSWSIWLFQDFIKCTRTNKPRREECILTFYLTIYCGKFWFQLCSTTIILHHILERNSDKPLVCRCHYWSTQRHIWNVMCSIKGEHCLLSPDKKGAQSKHSHYIYPKCFLSFQIIRCSVFF